LVRCPAFSSALYGETSLLSSSVSCCAATAEASFTYTCGAGGGARRQSISFSMSNRSKTSNYSALFGLRGANFGNTGPARPVPIDKIQS
jgi:hypothetical protein